MFKDIATRLILTYALVLLHHNTALAQHCYVFIGSFNMEKTQPGIYVYELDPASGQMKMCSSVCDVLNPAFLTLSQDGHYLYACTDAHTPGKGSVTSYSFDAAKGTLSMMNTQKSGDNPVYVSVHRSGKWLVNANYAGGSVSVFTLNSNGQIDSSCQTIAFTDSGANKERQDHSHIHSVVFSPQQDHLYLTDLGADKIRCFTFDTTLTQPLQATAPPYVTAVPGSGPRHLTFHPNGRFAYCTEEMGGTITAYTYTNGRLDSIQYIATHIGHKKRDHANADIHISPDGLFLYASNRGKENSIATFSIDQQTGILAMVNITSTLGKHPRNFAIDPTGKFLLVANQYSNNVVVFKRDMHTGLLSKTGIRIKALGASCLQVK